MEKEGYTVFTGPLKHKPKGQSALNKAEKHGEDILYIKKGDHTNQNRPIDNNQIGRLMNEEEDHKPPSMPQQLRIAIAQARNAKGWNQETFAHMLQIPKSDINSWQAGKSKPTGNQVAKMDKVLGVKLPRPHKQ